MRGTKSRKEKRRPPGTKKKNSSNLTDFPYVQFLVPALVCVLLWFVLKEEDDAALDRSLEQLLKEAGDVVCEDADNKQCPILASNGECDRNPDFMSKQCKKSCQLCFRKGELSLGIQQVAKKDTALRRIRQAKQYFRDVVMQESEYMPVRLQCRNSHESCSEWAVRGDCATKRTYMLQKCPLACMDCETLNLAKRCPSANAQEAFAPGDLNKMFERIATHSDFQIYQPTIHSRDPWVITLENFATPEECERLIALGHAEGYKQSVTVAGQKPKGAASQKKTTVRTSANAWCRNACDADDLHRQVRERIANVTGVPEVNSEAFQLLRYETGQLYETHHDYSAHIAKNRQEPVF